MSRLARNRLLVTEEVNKALLSLLWLKVVAVGDERSGKTSLIKYFCESKFNSVYQPTVGVDYGFKIHKVKEKEVRVHLWDLSGADEYADVRNELYVGSDAVILIYDVTDGSSAAGVDSWYKELCRFGLNDVVVYVIGNKTDLGKTDQRQDEVQSWAASRGLKYHRTSCATGEGIESVMTLILEDVMSKRSR